MLRRGVLASIRPQHEQLFPHAKKSCAIEAVFDPGHSVISRQVSRSKLSPIRIDTGCSGYAALLGTVTLSHEPEEQAGGLPPAPLSALYHLRRDLEAGAWRQYLDLPTGTGKSTLAAAFAAQRLGQTQGRVLALVHRQYLALQLAETLRQEELEVGLVMEGSHTLTTPVVVSTVQSLTPEATQDLLAVNATPHPDGAHR